MVALDECASGQSAEVRSPRQVGAMWRTTAAPGRSPAAQLPTVWCPTAELSGVTLATSVRASAAREAVRIPREHQMTVLSGRDGRTLLEALDNPPSPTAAARDAVRNYRARIANAG